ncbi:CYTH domain-containing protein [Caballeronia telluris]|uniref:Adenylate cyclase n=1 Tax=Caballeronia telluris TaxID=326475 RepID=A0A158K7K0_9BURK|nr:CYTH domain-containing protein [Caballeronia telluris]SAL76441.1 adenylate cyclase [Caballeronia telluris]
MGIEREIKLALPASQHNDAARFFTERTGREGTSIALANVYFDTPELMLAKAKSALRLRRTPQQWLQTYKTVGQSKAGLHSRFEWEMPVAGEALDVDAILNACGDEHARDALRQAAPELIAVFRTDFTRVYWDIEHDGAMIEAALDLGEVSAEVDGETRKTAISEVELELKSGDESALSTLSAELRGAFPDLDPDDVSKAERGYRLRAQTRDDSTGAAK